MLIAVLLNTQGLKFKRIWRAVYILPVVIPPIIVATVWRNMFDGQYGAINQVLTIIGGWFTIPPEVFEIDWLRESKDPIPFIPLPACVLRAADREHVARLAAQLGGGDGRAAEHPGRAVRGGRDGRRIRVAEVPDRHAHVPAAGHVARTRSTASW